jgi:HK97 family phage portal protein
MRLFGFELSLTKQKSLSSVGRGWWPLVRESFTGAWQRNEELSHDSVLGYYAVFACMTLIASDIGKLKPVLQRETTEGLWQDSVSPAFSPVLNKPNRYQNHIQFKEAWMISKLSCGNTYVLKQRDNRQVVTALYILDPTRVQVLVASDGSVYYQLAQDDLNNLASSVIVPASEIIHDRMHCLFHPLVGTSPLFACGLAAGQGLKMQQDSSRFFANGARPSGILTAPGAISDETAKRLKEHWDTNYSGEQAGKVAVLGDNLKFEVLRATAVDSQLVEQMALSAQMVCATFHVPPFKIGAGALPAGQKVDELNQIYYSDGLQSLIEAFELCLDEGLGLPDHYGITLDLDGLLRMDTATLYHTLGEGIKSAVLSPNEARKRLNRPPMAGGDSVYMQQQNYSLEALAKRDTQDNPFASGSTPNTSNTPPVPSDATTAKNVSITQPTSSTDLSLEHHVRLAALLLQEELHHVQLS